MAEPIYLNAEEAGAFLGMTANAFNTYRIQVHPLDPDRVVRGRGRPRYEYKKSTLIRYRSEHAIKKAA